MLTKDGIFGCKILSEGDVFGVEDLLIDIYYFQKVISEEDSICLRFNKEKLTEIILEIRSHYKTTINEFFSSSPIFSSTFYLFSENLHSKFLINLKKEIIVRKCLPDFLVYDSLGKACFCLVLNVHTKNI